MEPIFHPKPVNADETLEKYLQRFYSLNPIGVSMSTEQELFEMALALRKTANLYASVTADGKVDLTDLSGDNIQQLLELIPAVKAAVVVENGFDLSTLSPDQIRDLLGHLTETLFIFLKIEASGSSGATYRELREITDFLGEVVKLLGAFTEDGAITLTDALTNIGGIIDTAKAAAIAAKIDGTIDMSSLSHADAAELLSAIVSGVCAATEALKKLH